MEPFVVEKETATLEIAAGVPFWSTICAVICIVEPAFALAAVDGDTDI